MFNWMLTWHIILGCFAIPFGIMIHKKLYHNIKNEEHLEKGQIIQRIIKTYAIVQCILWPSCLILSSPFLDSTILNQIPPSPRFYLIQLSRCLSTFLRHFAGFHSLIIAISRYVFIIFNRKAEKIGIKRLRILFISSSIEVPLFITFVEVLFFPVKGWLSHFRFSEDLSENVMKNGSSFHQPLMDSDFYENALYHTIQSYFPQKLIGIIRWIVIITAITVYSNVVEGLMYGHIFMFHKRQERQGRIHSMLSEDSLRKRHRAKVISIHITLTSWLLEFVSNWFIIFLSLFSVQIESIKFVMLVIDTFSCFILIPASYICNTEKVKEYINSIGWYMTLIDKFRSNTVNPIQDQNIEMAVLPNHGIVHHNEIRNIPPVPKHAAKKLLRTKTQASVRKITKREERRRSLNIYSETLFDLSVY